MEITLKNISFKDKLSNINYSFEESKITSIIGTSGSGKTLLTYLLVELEKVSEGEIFNPYSLREIGYVFQYPKEQFFNMTVYDEIAFGLKKYNYKLEELDKRVDDALKLVSLPSEYLLKNPFSLSTGEQEKVAIASILALNPKVIILDEPTIYLDNKSIKKLIALLKKLSDKYHKTIIIVSNDIDFIYQISDNILLLKKGKIFYEDKIENVTDNIDKLIKSGFEVPKIIEFINLVKNKKNINLNHTLDIDKLVEEIKNYVK